jgi:hypothetical protein
MLLRHGLKDEASKLILLHKPLSVNRDKTGLILLFLCAFFFGLFLTSSFILNAGSLNGKLTWRGYIISQDKNPGAIVNVNFEDDIGKVREDFYGVNTHGKFLDEDITIIDKDDDGTRETGSNEEWHRSAFYNSKINFIRTDMYLESWTNNNIAKSRV